MDNKLGKFDRGLLKLQLEGIDDSLVVGKDTMTAYSVSRNESPKEINIAEGEKTEKIHMSSYYGGAAPVLIDRHIPGGCIVGNRLGSGNGVTIVDKDGIGRGCTAPFFMGDIHYTEPPTLPSYLMSHLIQGSLRPPFSRTRYLSQFSRSLFYDFEGSSYIQHDPDNVITSSARELLYEVFKSSIVGRALDILKQMKRYNHLHVFITEGLKKFSDDLMYLYFTRDYTIGIPQPDDYSQYKSLPDDLTYMYFIQNQIMGIHDLLPSYSLLPKPVNKPSRKQRRRAKK